MSFAQDFEQDDDLDGLTSEELEEQAFGPDPDRKRVRGRGLRRRRSALPARPVEAPVPVPVRVVVTKFCYACGAEVDARAEVCPHCGVRQPEAPMRGGRSGRKSKGAAMLLALTLGGVGAHRFYLGQPKLGALMLLFCWTMLPSLLGVVDFVRLAFMSDRRFAELYEAPGTARLLVPPHPASQSGHVSRPRAISAGADPEAASDPEAAPHVATGLGRP